jgi:antitoxin (DNA-binding transcriptional repressor) of toxin-antitoxin stability system
MRTLELKNASGSLREYAADLEAGPVVLTRKGKAVAALVRIRPSDLESLLVSESPIFKRTVERSRASYRRSGGLTRAEMEQHLERTRGT